jgi:hypothetical protein
MMVTRTKAKATAKPISKTVNDIKIPPENG